MLLKNKKDGCVYAVTTEYSEEGFEVYAELCHIPVRYINRNNVDSFAWTYMRLKDFVNDWEDWEE